MSNKTLFIGIVLGGAVTLCVLAAVVFAINIGQTAGIQSVVHEPTPTFMPTSTPIRVLSKAEYLEGTIKGMKLLEEGSEKLRRTMASEEKLTATWKWGVLDAIEMQEESMEIISALIPPKEEVPMHNKLLEAFVELKMVDFYFYEAIKNNDESSIDKALEHADRFLMLLQEVSW
jgi:hypothetical protein